MKYILQNLYPRKRFHVLLPKIFRQYFSFSLSSFSDLFQQSPDVQQPSLQSESIEMNLKTKARLKTMTKNYLMMWWLDDCDDVDGDDYDGGGDGVILSMMSWILMKMRTH